MRYGKLSGLALGLGLLLAACGGKNNEAALKQAAEIQKGIEDYLAVMEGPAEVRVLSHEKVTVALPEKGEGFLVTVDGVKLGSKEAGFLQIGQVAYALAAKDAKTYTASDLKIAGLMPFIGVDGKQSGALKLTPGAFAAEWSSELQTFLSLDFTATDLQAADSAGSGADIRAKLLSWKHQGTDKGSGVSDIVGTLGLEGFSAKDTTDGTVAMDKLTGKFSISGLRMAVYLEQVKKLRDVMGRLSAVAEAEAKAATAGADASAQPATPVPAPAQLSDADKKVLADYVRAIPKMFSGFLYQFDIAGLSFTAADGSKPFALGAAGFSFGAGGIDAEKAQIDLGISHDGLALSDPEFNDPLIKAVLPKTGSLALSLTDIPTQKLLDTVADALPNMLVNDPAMAEAGAYMVMGSLTQLLQQSNLKLKVNPSSWTGEVTTLKANGDFLVNPQSVMGAVGTLHLALSGLDELIKLAGDLAQTSPDAGQMIGMLQMLQSMAQRENGSDGKPVDNFKVEVKPTGETLVNDKPLPF